MTVDFLPETRKQKEDLFSNAERKKMINQLDIIDIYKILHSTTEYTHLKHKWNIQQDHIRAIKNKQKLHKVFSQTKMDSNQKSVTKRQLENKRLYAD